MCTDSGLESNKNNGDIISIPDIQDYLCQHGT